MKSLILIFFVFSLAAFIGARPLVLLQGADFPHFYCASRMLADGHGRQLYDTCVQRQYQARFAGRVGTLYTHPPFEAVLYLAVAWLPLRRAYLLWSLLSMAFLAAAVRHLARQALLPWDWRVLFVASLTFVPALLCLLQGQDSLLLLSLVVLAFTALRRGRAFAAGCWLALGLFKFQLVIPLVLVLVLTQGRSVRNGLAKGFSLMLLTLVIVSVAIAGWSVLTLYPRFVLHFQEQPFPDIFPQAMANLRGLTYFFFHREQSPWAVAILSILCTAALFKTRISWKHARMACSLPGTETQREFDLAFSDTVLCALLVSYHLNPQDLSLLLLPISLLLYSMLLRKPRLPDRLNWITAGLIGILFLGPLHLWALTAGVYCLVSIPLLALFLVSAGLTTQATSPGKATTIQC
ncbi:MAG: glycosyltransferase family 87 protein [Candidatus Sulfotelmatobacter sp.]